MVPSSPPADDVQPEVAIRPALVADIPAVIELIEPFVLKGKLLTRTFDELEQLLRHSFVAVRSVPGNPDRVVGFSALEIYSPKLAEVRSLAVAEPVQGQGIGRRLVEACLQRAREQNVLEVLAITSAERFFLGCGFDFTLPGEKKALFFQSRSQM
jgi:N-acetylglutamate synthase-like GNAT family acetyltransferase